MSSLYKSDSLHLDVNNLGRQSINDLHNLHKQFISKSSCVLTARLRSTIPTRIPASTATSAQSVTLVDGTVVVDLPSLEKITPNRGRRASSAGPSYGK